MPERVPRDASLVKPILMFSRVRRCFKGWAQTVYLVGLVYLVYFVA
jgi:hypothetical protein